jgi:Raf kinase inhibitor-like YbhB/YbcL family protein
MTLQLTSTAFEEGQPIPLGHTGEGHDLSPLLKWNDPPARTRSLALICEDPDAPHGTFTHWVIFNIPAESRELPEGMVHREGLPNGTRQGRNDFGKLGYNGPKPPAGKPHRYFFKLFALDRPLDVTGSETRDHVIKAMEGHILAEAQLMGTFKHGGSRDIPDDLIARKHLQDPGAIRTAPLA